jgi:hypothetical protein
MSDIRIETQLGAPPVLAFQALGEILAGIASQQGEWRDFPLHLNLADAGLADVGYVEVPMALDVRPRKPDLERLDVTFRAARHPESFPAFDGALGVDATGPTGAMLWLAGTYEVPLHGIGRFIDSTLMRDLAQTTLKNLLNDIAAACRARIDKREAEHARYRHPGFPA